MPYLSVTLGLAFALASLGVLIYFIHHVAGTIQAEHAGGRRRCCALLDTIAAIAEHVHRAEDRASLLRHAGQVAQDAREALTNERDLHEVEQRHAATLQALAKGG